MNKSDASQGQSASELISERIAELGDWRGETLSRMRKLIQEADPDVVEEWKWMGTPVWSHAGDGTEPKATAPNRDLPSRARQQPVPENTPCLLAVPVLDDHTVIRAHLLF